MITEVAVVVPAANEEQLVGACLDSLLVTARELVHATDGAVSTRVYVVLDDCVDATAEIVSRCARAATVPITTVRVALRSVGRAREAGARRAIAEAGDSDALWIASTDSDSEVPANWLRHMLDESRRGVDLVLGTVFPDGDLDPTLHAAWSRGHQIVDGHPYVHGANLGVRARTLVAVGGWPPLHVHEDVGLVSAVLAAGASVSRTAAIPVRTSTRLAGRAPQGFAGYLRALVG